MDNPTDTADLKADFQPHRKITEDAKRILAVLEERGIKEGCLMGSYVDDVLEMARIMWRNH